MTEAVKKGGKKKQNVVKNILPDQSKIYIFIWYLKISILGTGESLIKISQAQVEVFALLQI